MSTERVTIPIEGLACAGCVADVEKTMREQQGVIWATINFAAQEVQIVYDPTQFDVVKLVKAVQKLGYELSLGVEQITSLKTRLPIRRLPLQHGLGGRA
jgi:copper chaperone CopZ